MTIAQTCFLIGWALSGAALVLFAVRGQCSRQPFNLYHVIPLTMCFFLAPILWVFLAGFWLCIILPEKLEGNQ
jgi:hypothetical protein